MKKQLLSILALILCFCTVFVLASCGKQKENDESSSDESLNESILDNGDESFDVEEGLEDVDSVTAEDIFAQMKSAYKATLDHKTGYSITVNWVETQTDSEVGKGGETTNGKFVTKETITADPSAGKAAYVLTNEEYEGSKKTATTTQQTKIFNQSNKNYIYSASKTDGQIDFESYNTLSDYGFASQKDIMLLSSYFAPDSHFTESFGDPFSASSASDLKTVHNSVINEVKENQKERYEADGYVVKALSASANIIFNKTKDTNIFKRTITVSTDLQNDGGTYQKNLTVESLLKSKDGKILSFVSTTTQSTMEKVGTDYTHQADSTSSLSYDFSYSMNDSDYNAINTTAPASNVAQAPDYFETPLTLYINGEEVAITVIGESSDTVSVADVLENTIDNFFADSNIEYDGQWYTDPTCTTKFDISSVTSIEKLMKLNKLYNSSFKVNGNCALFIDSGKETVNVPKNYTIVFGNALSDKVLDCTSNLMELGDENIARISYMPDAGHNVTIKLNGKELKYNANIDESDFQEDSDGSYFHEFMFEGGKIYFVKRANVATKTYYTLDSFYVNF